MEALVWPQICYVVNGSGRLSLLIKLETQLFPIKDGYFLPLMEQVSSDVNTLQDMSESRAKDGFLLAKARNVNKRMLPHKLRARK